MDDANRREFVSVARAILTFAVLLAGLAVLALVLPERGDWILLVLLAFWATALPLAALLCAAPGFRLKQYILNGSFVALAFPITAYVWFDANGIDDPGPQALFVIILISGPGLLGLGITALVLNATQSKRRPTSRPSDGVVSRSRPARPTELWLFARALLAVARAGVTSITLIAVLGMTFFEGAHLSGESEVRAAVAVSAVAFPTTALLFAAPSFRMPEYLLNGGFALFAVPIFLSVLYPSDGVSGPLTHNLGIVVAISGPALVTLIATMVALVYLRRSSHGTRVSSIEPTTP